MITQAPNDFRTHMTPFEVQAHLDSQSITLIDVRGYDEFATGHVEGACCVPLPDLERRVGEFPTDRPIVMMCRSGSRSAMAAERLHALDMDDIREIQGGLDAWIKAGLPTIRQTAAVSLERQVRIAAGVFVFCFTVAGFARDKRFFFGAGFVGMMLALTGALDICPMMSVLRHLPWNRVKPRTP